ncbi:MAG: hypothetical protein N2235_17340 [Fischerella sp.]|nr:hypothetical protein [Fischerella sp.]
MSNENTLAPSGIKRIIYKEIVDGDRRKFKARSNDSESGGGARDLRFRPFERLGQVFERMFPDKNDQGICVGRFYWVEDAQTVCKDAYFHPPTTSRPNEGRIANIDKYLPKNKIPAADGGNRVILLLVQRTDGTVWPSFTTERSLESGRWDRQVSEAILSGLHARRRAGVAATGFIDFEVGEVYHNGN